MACAFLATIFPILGTWSPLPQVSPSKDPPDEKRVEVQLPADWKVGTRYQVRVTKNRVDQDGLDVTSSSESITDIDVEFVERREDGYLLRWKIGSAILSANGRLVLDPAATAVADWSKGLVVDLITDECGTPQRMENREQVLAALEKGYSKLEDLLRADPKNAGKVDFIMQEVRKIASSATFDQVLIRDPSVLLFPCGGAYALRQPNEYETMVATPWTQEPIPATGRLALEELRADEGVAVIVWTQAFDPVKAAAVLREVARGMLERAGKSGIKDDEIPELSIDDQARYEFDLASGIPRNVDYSRTVRAGSRRRVDRTRFEVTWPKAK